MNSSISSQSAIISWSAPEEHYQNGIIISYTVLVFEFGSEESLQFTSSDTSITLTSLMPYSSYFISVAASTSVGLGPYSTTITLNTLEDGMQLHPVNANIYMYYKLPVF